MSPPKPILNFAIIGCGNIAKKHLTCIQHLSESRLVGVCDVNQENLKKFSAEHHVEAFDSIDVMIDKCDPDVLVILTPSGSHAEIVKQIAVYKRHILVEKPISLKLSDAQAMNDACKKYNSTLSVVKQNRFNNPIKLARNLFSSGSLGNLFLGTIRVRWSRDQQYYDSADWRGTWKNDGGVICNQAIHHIDMLQWFMGDVASVYSSNTNAILNIEAEDTSISVVKFKNGSLGVIEASTAIRPTDLEGSISLLGTKGSIEIGGFAMNQIVKLELEDKSVINHFANLTSNPSEFAFAHIEFYKDYVAKITSNKTPTIDGQEAIKSLKIVHAIYKSHLENREVFLDEPDLQTQLGV